MFLKLIEYIIYRLHRRQYTCSETQAADCENLSNFI